MVWMNHSRPAATWSWERMCNCLKKLRKEISRSVLHTVLQSMHTFCIWFPFLTIGCLHEKLTFFRLDFVVLLYRHCLLRNSMVVQTWNKAVESSLKPSEPGCRTRDMADGSSSASKALKATSPNTLAWVSGWALSWCDEWHLGKIIK